MPLRAERSNEPITPQALGTARQQPPLPWPIFSEPFVLHDLLTQSALFRSYYHAERGKIEVELAWAHDLALPAGIDYRRTTLSTTALAITAHVIRLRRIPAVLADAMGVAHELQHFILDREGYSTVGASPCFEVLSASLASMLHDPIVNVGLRNYGFDLQGAYNVEVQESIRQLSTRPQVPTRAIDQIHWVFNYTAKLLDRDVLESAGGDAADDFQTWFEQRYPTIAAEAHDLHTVITSMGYTLPEQQLQLFHIIIQRYQLQQLLMVIDRSPNSLSGASPLATA